MKKLTLCLLLVGEFIFSQSTNAQVRLGVKAGVNASNVSYGFMDNKLLLGYQGGVVADISLATSFSIQPALLYVTKGFSTELEFRNDQGTLTGTGLGGIRINYLELPVLVLYKTEIGKSSRFFVGLGPYVAVGINGKSDFGIYMSRSNIRFASRKNSKFGTYNRMDYGLAAAAGLEFGRIVLTANYDLGLETVGPFSGGGIDPTKAYNRNLGLTAGYWFGKAR